MAFTKTSKLTSSFYKSGKDMPFGFLLIEASGGYVLQETAGGKIIIDQTEEWGKNNKITPSWSKTNKII